MGLSIERNNFISLQRMWKSIVDDLVAGGFEVELAAQADGTGAPSIAGASTSYDEDTVLYVLRPTVSVDAVFDTQPWRLVIRIEDIVDSVAYGVTINVVTPTQVLHDTVNHTFAIAAPGEHRELGILHPTQNSRPDTGRYFFSRSSSKTVWGCYPEAVDVEAVPLSYRLSVSDHGVALMTWAESFDGAGNCFNWFCVQRMVGQDGVPITTGHAPLFCVFSRNGGGSEDVNDISNSDISKFVVRESDVNAPTRPVSAAIPTADSSPIINPIQQVGISEDNKMILNFPQGLNTQRYSYTHELDMFCYTSADVISQFSEPEITLYGEATPRKYKAMNANHSNNKGMRLLLLTQGAGIPAA